MVTFNEDTDVLFIRYKGCLKHRAQLLFQTTINDVIKVFDDLHGDKRLQRGNNIDMINDVKERLNVAEPAIRYLLKRNDEYVVL